MVDENVVEKKVRENKKDTPKEMIDAMNLAHQEWKKTKQEKYNKDGLRQ